MKGAWAVLLVLVGGICVGWDKSSDSGKASPLKGWKVVIGEWTKQKKWTCCSCEAARLEWEGEIEESVEIAFQLVVRRWFESDRSRIVGLVWGAGREGKPEFHAVLGIGNVTVAVRPENPGQPDKKFAYAIPLNKPVRVRAKITKQGIQLMVGRQKITADVTCDEIGKLHLAVSRADVAFGKVKVKAK